MANRENHLGQPIGKDISWHPASPPPRQTLKGRFCTVEPLDIDRHAPDLFTAFSQDKTGSIWTYMVVGPFDTLADFRSWLTDACLGDDPLFHTIIDRSSGKAVGLAALMRNLPDMGVIEVGNISFAPSLQRTAMATEAMFLLMQQVFALGYRRYEWKCDALNAPSIRAAKRLGFTFEGVFRQAIIYKGRNRDTAWLSILDSEWPALRTGFENWLAAENFDKTGQQIKRLKDFRP
ncbi:MAG: GNAT family protein [Paracoccaceae bacterium]